MACCAHPTSPDPGRFARACRPWVLTVALVIPLSVAWGQTKIVSKAEEPGTRMVVIEDDSTRIEELHVRGEVRRVVVLSKRSNMPAWEISPDPPGRNIAGESRLPRDSANTRMWRVWSF